MTQAKPGIHAVVCRDNPGDIYLLSGDVIAMARESQEKFETLIARASDRNEGYTEEGRLQIAALVGASAVLHSVIQQLELMCIEMATDAEDLIQKEKQGG